MNWCFAIINGKLAEIYFETGERKPKILGHAFVKKEEFKTKSEQKYIKEDTLKFKFSYKNGKYQDIGTHEIYK